MWSASELSTICMQIDNVYQMWLLSTHYAELRFFSSPEAVAGGYAILSHTWGTPAEEQTFQELRAIDARCKVSNENPLDLVSHKIRRCCFLARERGFDWVWIDTCCIDKTSSVELSEAINSMFRWYASAEVCFVYLGDVPAGCDLAAQDSAFRKAKWFQRGWTLQELIAPLNILFFSLDWQYLGSKLDTTELLQSITRVPCQILTREKHFASASIAERMSWVSKRVTTRPEDIAYCLMGLFDVNLPTLYGEGRRRAFQRLQQEIMKASYDPSLFAWGEQICVEEKDHELLTRSNMNAMFGKWTRHPFALLAETPHNFSERIAFTPNLASASQPYLFWQVRKLRLVSHACIATIRHYFRPLY